MLPWEHHQYLLSQTAPALRYDGSQPLAQWRSEATLKLRELLGIGLIPPCELELEIGEPEDMGTYTRARVSYQSEPGYRVPGYWLVPKAAGRDVMICLQGHSTGMHISIGEAKYPKDEEDIRTERDIAVQAVARGMYAFVVEQRNFGECGGRPEGGPDCYMPAMTALLLGRTTLAERVTDVMRTVDAIERLLPSHGDICCMGNSGGGTATWYSAALEPRITKAMPSCAVCSYDGSIAPMNHCSCNYVPGIRRWFDMGDLAGLVAPRPIVVVAGMADRIFPIDATRETFALIQSYYKAAGAPENCKLHVGAGGHAFYPDAWEDFGGNRDA